MSDVFISHAREDRAFVDRLAAALQNAGFSVWWKVSDRFGESEADEIEEALAAAKGVVAVWSHEALAARNVKAEAADALERGVLVCAMKEDVTPPLAFRELPGGDLTGWEGGPHPGLDALIAALAVLTGRAAPPPAPVPAPTAGVASARPAGDENDDRTQIAPTEQRFAAAADSQAAPAERTIFRPRALRTGEIVAHYRIVGPLGEGGSGAIYEGRNIHNEDERVAVKLILPGVEEREHFFVFLRSEANALQRIKHDAVVQYRTFGRIENSEEFFLVIEFVEGPTLAEAMRRRPLAASELKRLAIRICGGLQAAHDQGVIHRDLSPDNIVLPGGDPERATLIDFGIARLGGVDPLGLSFAGKLSYCAPEQFNADEGKVGPWSDLYSLGLVLAAAARGRKLDMGRGLVSALEHRRAVPELNGVPEELHASLKRLLEPDPGLRVQTAIEAAALFSEPAPLQPGADKGLVVIRDPDGASEPPPVAAPPGGGRMRVALWIAASALLAAVVLLLFRLDFGFGPSAPPEPPAAETPIADLRPAEDGAAAEGEGQTSVPAADQPTPQPTPPLPAEAPPETPPRESPPTADPALDPALVAPVTGAREAAALARTADSEAMRAADAAGIAEASARSTAAEADNAAAAACMAGADPARYQCGPDDDAPLDYRGEIVLAAGGKRAPHGLGVLTLGDGTVHRGLFAEGSPAGDGVRGVEGDDCAGPWIGDAMGPLGACTVRATAQKAGVRTAGSFRGSRAHGPATVVFEDGSAIRGEFADGLKDGAAVVLAPQGSRAELAFAADAPVTGVVMIMRDGALAARYEGEFGRPSAIATGLPLTLHGLGVLYGPDGAIRAQGRWSQGRLVEPMGKTGGEAGLEPLPPLPEPVLDARLAEAMAAAADAVARSEAAAVEADAAAARADEAAATARDFAEKAKAASVRAIAAKKKACGKKPPKGYACFTASGGAHYGGEVKCERSGVCTSRGYGVLTSTNGWAYEGLWNTKQMELGCEAENGVYRFCGQEGVDPAFGMFTRADGLVTYCLTSVKADTIQGVFDFSAVLSDKIKVIRGGALNGYVEGPGVVEGKDGALYRGAFALSIRKGPALAVSGAGARIAARYERGVPVSGQVIYPDGSRYQGEFAGGDGTVALPHGLGALFAADGRILRQGRWAGGELVESFAPPRASAEASNPD